MSIAWCRRPTHSATLKKDLPLLIRCIGRSSRLVDRSEHSTLIVVFGTTCAYHGGGNLADCAQQGHFLVDRVENLFFGIISVITWLFEKFLYTHTLA